jgi:hypothetical protein
MKKKHILMVIVLALLFMTSAALLAQSSANFNLGWHVIGSGGGESTSAHYRVNGSMGQSLASPPKSSNASFTLNSGYWFNGSNGGEIAIYMPAVLKN